MLGRPQLGVNLAFEPDRLLHDGAIPRAEVLALSRAHAADEVAEVGVVHGATFRSNPTTHSHGSASAASLCIWRKAAL